MLGAPDSIKLFTARMKKPKVKRINGGPQDRNNPANNAFRMPRRNDAAMSDPGVSEWHPTCWKINGLKAIMNVRLAISLLVLYASWTHAADAPQIIDLEIGQSLDLRQFNGPNVSLIVNQIDISDVMITLLDYGRIQGTGGGDAWSGYSMSIGPTATHRRVKKEDGALLFSWGPFKVSYIDAIDTHINHVKLGIISK
jgi:hypothetical protein